MLANTQGISQRAPPILTPILLLFPPQKVNSTFEASQQLHRQRDLHQILRFLLPRHPSHPPPPSVSCSKSHPQDYFTQCPWSRFRVFTTFQDPKSPIPNHNPDVTTEGQVHSYGPGIPLGPGSHPASPQPSASYLGRTEPWPVLRIGAWERRGLCSDSWKGRVHPEKDFQIAEMVPLF